MIKNINISIEISLLEKQNWYYGEQAETSKS